MLRLRPSMQCTGQTWRLRRSPPPRRQECKTGWSGKSLALLGLPLWARTPFKAPFGHHAEGQKVPTVVLSDREKVSLLP